MDKKNRLILAIIISLLFVIVEVVGGILANSLAILNDAAHLAIDSSGFLLALLAYIYSELPGDRVYTFGYSRIETIGALISVLSLWVITFFLALSAYDKVIKWFAGNADPVNGKLTFIFGCFGVFVNLILAFVFKAEHDESHLHMHDHSHSHNNHSNSNNQYERLKVNSCHLDNLDIETNETNRIDHHGHDHHGHDHHQHCSHEKLPIKSNTTTTSYSGNHTDDKVVQSDANAEAALLHVITDLIQSIGVAIAGFLIWCYPNLTILDPLCVFVFSILVVYTTIPLIRKCTLIMMDACPEHINYAEIDFQLKSISSVISVHHLHIWSVSSNHISASVHIEGRDTQSISKAAKEIFKAHGIHHSTVQVTDNKETTIEDLRHLVPLCI